jgi:hypothetical protein
MPTRRIPVHPNLHNLKNQAKTLLDAYRSGNSEASAVFVEFHPRRVTSQEVKLSDAQLVLARSYGFPSWSRLKVSVQFCAAVWKSDVEEVRRLVTEHPVLLTEPVRGADSDWGAAMAFAANLGRTEIVELLAGLGAMELQFALQSAASMGEIETAQRLVELGAKLECGMIMEPCETLNSSGLQFLVDRGAEIADREGNQKAPVAMVLRTYSRNPQGKHECLEILAKSGISLPDTPVMAFHRGRIDMLDDHLHRDPALLRRQFRLDEIYPPEFCRPQDSGLHGTPLDGTTLLHMAVDFDEQEIFDWLLTHDADPNARATIDRDGFGGHSPLFNCVVSQAVHCGRQQDAVMTIALLDRGADPTVRVSLRKALKFTADESLHEFRYVTPVEYARQFHERTWVNETAVALIEERIGNK